MWKTTRRPEGQRDNAKGEGANDGGQKLEKVESVSKTLFHITKAAYNPICRNAIVFHCVVSDDNVNYH